MLILVKPTNNFYLFLKPKGFDIYLSTVLGMEISRRTWFVKFGTKQA